MTSPPRSRPTWRIPRKIAVFCTGYSEGNGCHDVHYENGNGKDGAIVLDSDFRELAHAVLPLLRRRVLTVVRAIRDGPAALALKVSSA